MLGPSRPPSSLLLALIISPPFLGDDPFVDTQSIPQPPTSTRLKPSPAAAPGSTTVLDSELTNSSRALRTSALLRLLP
ncbi:hypothetical protein B1218_37965, partial [Pseudomonas ogarae]